MKQTTKLGALLLMAALMIGALFIPEQAYAAGYPSLKQESLKLKVGESKTLKLKNSKGMKATFDSTDPSVATVSKKGKVTGKSGGTAVIFVMIDDQWSCTCNVFVSAKSVAKKTVKDVCGGPLTQTQIIVDRSVENASYEITISTKSKDENLDLKFYEVTSGTSMSEVGKISPAVKKLTLTTSSNKIIVESATYDVPITVKVKTKDGKKTINKVSIENIRY